MSMLLHLPLELLYLIFESPLLQPPALVSLTATCRSLHITLTPLLRHRYRHTLLLFASQRGLPSLAADVLARGAILTTVDKVNKWPPLHWAVMGGHIDMVRLLLDHGASMTAQGKGCWTTLKWAAATGPVVASVLEKKGVFDLWHKNVRRQGHKDPMYPFFGRRVENSIAKMIESKTGLEDTSAQVAIVKMLLAGGASMDYRGRGGKSALCLALQFGHSDVVRVFLELGAFLGGVLAACEKLQGEVKSSMMAMVLAAHKTAGKKARIPDYELTESLIDYARKGDESTVKMLLDHVVDSGRVRSRRWQGAIYEAVRSGHERVVVMLLDTGIDVNINDIHRGPLLHCALRVPQMLSLLLSRGADPSRAYAEGLTLLHILCGETVNTDILKSIGILINHPVDLNASDIHGKTPLHRAVISSTQSVVELLIKHGADANIKDSQGLTPLHWACMARLPSILEVLISNGGDVNVRNNGRTILHEIIYRSEMAEEVWNKEWTVWRIFTHNMGNTVTYRLVPEQNTARNIRVLATWEGMVKKLVEKGCPLWVLDESGLSAEEAARLVGWETMNTILEKLKSEDEDEFLPEDQVMALEMLDDFDFKMEDWVWEAMTM